MNKLLVSLLLTIVPLTFLSGCAAPNQPHSRVDVGGSFVNGDLNSFYLSVGEYYRVPERDVIFIRERRIPDYEIPVVLFISQRARVTPSVIVNLRLSGSSWMDISLRFGLGPDIYYVPVQNIHGAPYGHAYGHYRNRNRNEWHRIRLDDDDVVNLVNLRFISERYGYPPEDVMRMRSSGRNFVNIHDEARRSRQGGESRQQERRDSRESEQQRERQEREYRQQERRNDRESEMQRERQEREIRQQERKNGREPEMQRERQEREIRQQERRDGRDSVRQQGAPEKAGRQQERQETRESAKQQDRQEKESRKKGRGAEDDSSEPQDKKARGVRRGTDEEQAR